MQIRVAKEEGGKLLVVVVSQATPPMPAVAVQHVAPSDVAEIVTSVLAEFKRARVSMVQCELF